MAKVNSYQLGKQKAREEAINWQNDDKEYSYSELIDARVHFEKLAKRFGLVREFIENCII